VIRSRLDRTLGLAAGQDGDLHAVVAGDPGGARGRHRLLMTLGELGELLGGEPLQLEGAVRVGPDAHPQLADERVAGRRLADRPGGGGMRIQLLAVQLTPRTVRPLGE